MVGGYSKAASFSLRSYVRESGKADREGDKMAASMEKKIAELEMGLLHLQQVAKSNEYF